VFNKSLANIDLTIYFEIGIDYISQNVYYICNTNYLSDTNINNIDHKNSNICVYKK